MSLLTDVRADTSSILTDWGESVTVQRATRVAVSGAGGETTAAWATTWAGSADVQALPLRGRQSREAIVMIGGYKVPAEKLVVFPHGATVAEGDRFSFDNRYHILGKVLLEEDKVLALAVAETWNKVS